LSGVICADQSAGRIMLKVGLIVGSTRPNRFADVPVQWLVEGASARPDLRLTVLDLRDYRLPFFNEPASPVATGGIFTEPEAEASAAAAIAARKQKTRAGFTESSIFHGKSEQDYQGRTYMYPPYGVAPQLNQEAGSQESFIPKVCIHTWTGHTGGIAPIRLFPGTSHLLLSASMDTKIKVRTVLVAFPLIWC